MSINLTFSYLSIVKKKEDYFNNSSGICKEPLVMYVDMNSYFASCEQQRYPELRYKPLGVVTYSSANPAVIAASSEAKSMGVKTGMRLQEAKQFCPGLLTITTHPAWYREIHVNIMAILRRYCDDVIPRSIDEAVCNFHSYKLVYKDLTVIARQIKADITAKYDYLKCSIGIAPNTFLAKLGTELEKRDGLQVITEDNIDEKLATLSLTSLPGIASRNERRLRLIGINDPVAMRHSSPALLRKAFGGVVGDYWHKRLNFGEVDMYNRAENRTMSATRTLSRQQSQDPQQLESMLIALCTRLEQRLVKGELFCREVFFSIRYADGSRWDTAIKLADPLQDALEMRGYIKERMTEYEQSRGMTTLLTANTTNLTVAIQGFIKSSVMQYSLFDNRMKKDQLRKVVYEIKDRFDQKNIVRKGAEMFSPYVMKDAVGFGSVRDMGVNAEGKVRNRFMLEEDKEAGSPRVRRIVDKPEVVPEPAPEAYGDIVPGDEGGFSSIAAMYKDKRSKEKIAAQKNIEDWKRKALGK